MSTQFAPRDVPVPHDLTDDVILRLRQRDVNFTHIPDEAHDRFRVAPGYETTVAGIIREVRASKEEERQASLREARASVSVGGLSVEQAERLIALVKDAPDSVKRQISSQIPGDLTQALGISDPEHEATIVVRFRRAHRPGTHETQEWVREALHYYFNEVEAYCGRTDSASEDYPDSEEHILDVTVREVVSLSD